MGEHRVMFLDRGLDGGALLGLRDEDPLQLGLCDKVCSALLFTHFLERKARGLPHHNTLFL